MQLQNPAASGNLMKSVDILRNDRLQPAAILQLRKQPVGPVRLRSGMNHLAAVEIKKMSGEDIKKLRLSITSGG